MDEVITNPTQFIKVAVRYDFVVNEFPRIQVRQPKKPGRRIFAT